MVGKLTVFFAFSAAAKHVMIRFRDRLRIGINLH